MATEILRLHVTENASRATIILEFLFILELYFNITYNIILYFNILMITDNCCKPQHPLKVLCFALTPIYFYYTGT